MLTFSTSILFLYYAIKEQNLYPYNNAETTLSSHIHIFAKGHWIFPPYNP